MRYEFYDREGNLLGRSEDPEGAALVRNEEITHRFADHTATRWKAVGVTIPMEGVQMVVVRPV